MRRTGLASIPLVLGLLVSTTAHGQSPLEPPPPPPPGAATEANADQSAPNPPLTAPIPDVKPPEAMPPIETERPFFSIVGPGDARVMTEAPRWYGWQTLLALIPADALLIPALADFPKHGGSGLLIAGYAINTLAAPIVHWSHGHAVRGFSSYAINVLATSLGGFAGLGAGKDAFPIIFGLTVLGVQSIDVAFLSRDTVRVPLKNSSGLRTYLPSAIGIVPMADAQKKGVWLMGRF